MKQKIQIEVDIPAGYEAIEYRLPEIGDTYLLGLVAVETKVEPGEPRIILRKVWSFPVWFAKGWWLYQNFQLWYVTDAEPVPHGNKYWQRSDAAVHAMFANPIWAFHNTEFVPPPTDKLQCP